MRRVGSHMKANTQELPVRSRTLQLNSLRYNPHLQPLFEAHITQLSARLTAWKLNSSDFSRNSLGTATAIRIRLCCLYFSTHLENSSRKSGALSRSRNKMLFPWNLPKQLHKLHNCIWGAVRKDRGDEVSFTQVLRFVHVLTLSGKWRRFPVWSEREEHRD